MHAPQFEDGRHPAQVDVMEMDRRNLQDYVTQPEYQLSDELPPDRVHVIEAHVDFTYGGQDSVVGDESDALSELGCHVSAITVQDMNGVWSGNFPVHPIEFIPGHQPTDGFRPKEELYPHADHAADNALPIVLDEMRQSGAQVAMLRGHHAAGALLVDKLQQRLNRMGVPSVGIATIHSLAEEKFDGTPMNDVLRYRLEQGGNYRRMVEYEIYRHMAETGGLTTASPLQLYYLREYGIDLDKVAVIPPGINHDHFNTNGDPEQDWGVAQHRFGIEPGTPFIYSPGRMSDQKGHHKTIEAFAQIAQYHPDVQILFSGGRDTSSDLAYKQRLMELAAQYGIADRIYLHAALPQDEVASLYRVTQAAVYNSSYDHYNLMLGEGAACGAPTIGSKKMGATLSALHHSENSVIPVNPSNTTEISTAMHTLLTNPGLREDMSRNAVDWAKTLRADVAARKVYNLGVARLQGKPYTG